MLAADARSAISRDSVIPARLPAQCIEGAHMLQEALAHSIWRSRQMVKIDLLVPVVGAQADHVALIRDEVDECKLPVEATDSRITLPDGLPRLDREAERRGVCELETDDGMCNPRRTPVVDREIDAGDLRKPHGPRLPVGRVVGRGAIIAVANIVKSKFVAVYFRPRQLRHIGLPIAIVARFECEPPAKHNPENQRNYA